MDLLRNVVARNASVLVPVYRGLTGLAGTVMVAAGIQAFFDPAGMAKQIGLPIATSTVSTTESNTISRNNHAVGWPMVFAGRGMALGATYLLLNYLGEMKALAIVAQATSICGIVDSVATYRHGTEGSYKGHLYTTVFFSWLGPLGLLLFW